MNTSYSKFKLVISSIVICLIYVIAGYFSLKFASFHPSAAAFWVPTGIAISAMLLLDYRIWPAIFIGSFLVNLITTPSIALSLITALGYTFEALTASFFIRNYADGKFFNNRLRNIFIFTIFVLLSTTISATIGAASLFLFHFARLDQLGTILFTRWLGNFSGAIVTSLLIIVLYNQKMPKYALKSLLELVALFCVLITISLFTFGGILTSGRTQNFPLEIINMPIILWVALRFGQRETVIGSIILFAIAIWGTLHGYGPFVRPSQNESLLFLQTFLTITTLTGISVTTIVSEREQSILETQRLAAIVESSEDAIVSKNLKGIIQSWNKAAEDLFGYKRNEIIGKSITNLYPGDRLDEFSYIMNQISQGKKLEHFETERVKKDGSKVPISMSVSPLKNKFGVIVGASTIERDITKRVELERLRNEFFSIAAHQLRTPLTSMRWNLEIVLDDKKQPIEPRLGKVILKTYQSILHMIFLVSRLLEVKKIEQGKVVLNPAQIDVFLKIQAIMKSMESEANQRKITMTLNKSTTVLPYIKVDPEQFSEVVQNLLSNALKYSKPEGGVIKVDLSSPNNKTIELKVADNGIGIPAEEQSFIFNQFFRARNAATSVPEGSGLGLYMIKMIVENWGGTIKFESSEGKDTIFYVTIPIKE